MIKKIFRSALLPYFVLLVVAFSIRCVSVGTLPKGLNWDEVAYGYNAYSLLSTGRDEWGKSYPLFLKSFGEYKPALLSYFLIPSLLIFQDWNFAIRLVPAMLGTVGVIATYGFFSELTRSKKIAFLTALILAITPWHIHYSRAVMDPIIAHTFLLLGMWGWQKTQTRHRILGAIFLIISMYTYNAERVFIPLLLLAHTIIFRLEHWRLWRNIKPMQALPFVVFFIGTVWIVTETIFGVGGTRARIVSVFGSEVIQNSANEQITRERITGFPVIKVLDNKPYFLFMDISKRYFEHFRPDFLFFEGGNLTSQHGFSHYGNLLLIMLPFALIGGWLTLRNSSRVHLFMVSWIALSPLASAVTIDTPHSGRTLFMVTALCYLIAIGIIHVTHCAPTQRGRKVLAATIFFLFALNFFMYVRDYFLFFPEESFKAWQGYYSEPMQFLAQKQSSYQRIYFTDAYDSPLIFYAWYNKVNPLIIQTALRDPFNISQFANIDVFVNKNPQRWCLFTKTHTLIVVDPSYTATLATPPLKTFFYFNRFTTAEASFVVYDTDKLEMKDRTAVGELCQESKFPRDAALPL